MPLSHEGTFWRIVWSLSMSFVLAFTPILGVEGGGVWVSLVLRVPLMPRQPSNWVLRFAHLAPNASEVLDVACGDGRHTLVFLERGHRVTAVDLDISQLGDVAGYPNLELVGSNLEEGAPWPFEDRQFGAVVVTDYLYRPRLDHIISAVALGGVLIYETFGVGQEAYGRPTRPDFLLKPGELLELVKGEMQVVAYEHGVITEPGPCVRQRLCAVRAEVPAQLG